MDLPQRARSTQRTKSLLRMDTRRDRIEHIASEIVDSCITVHRELGAGLLESVYQACLTYELRDRGLSVRCEVPVRVRYKGKLLDTGFRADMLIQEEVIVENKCLQAVLPIHEAQLLTYLRLSRLRLGFLVNWNVLLIKDGIQRRVLNL